MSNNLTRKLNNEVTNDLPDGYLRCCSCISLSKDNNLVLDYEDMCYADQLHYAVHDEIPRHLALNVIKQAYPILTPVAGFDDGVLLNVGDYKVWGVPNTHKYLHVGDIVRCQINEDVFGRTVWEVLLNEKIQIKVKNSPIGEYKWPTTHYYVLTREEISELFDEKFIVV